MRATKREDVKTGDTIRLMNEPDDHVVLFFANDGPVVRKSYAGLIATPVRWVNWSAVDFPQMLATPGVRYWWKRPAFTQRAVIGVTSGQVAWTAESISGGTMFWFEAFNPETMTPCDLVSQ